MLALWQEKSPFVFDCYFKDAIYNLCNEPGHIKPIYALQSSDQPKSIAKKSRFKKTVHSLQVENDELPLHILTVVPISTGIADICPQFASDVKLGTYTDEVVTPLGAFISNLSTRLSPLNNLLKADVEWKWTDQCEATFKDIKMCLGFAPVLAHYGSDLSRVTPETYGIASVSSHRYEDGSERPITYASRTLTEAEKNYAQIDREALAVVFGVKRFNDYLFSKPFILVTDNRPLTHIFAPGKCTPNVAAARIQKWAVYFGAHKYIIEHRPAMKQM